MFDRRVNGWITVDAYLFDASLDDGLSAEVQVNPEFGGPDEARVEAEKYAEVIGRLPTVLCKDVQTVWIHQGARLLGGGNNNLFIRVGRGVLYTSLDAAHARALGCLAAQAADGNFISTYAKRHPLREDIAESFVPWVAVRYRPDRISQSLANIILSTIPNRLAHFDTQSSDMYPTD